MPRSIDHQRGVALLTAVLMVALGTILAVDIAFRGYLDQRRAMTTLAFDQSFELALGAEAWAADILALDYKNDPKSTHLGQRWATPLPPIPVEGGEIQGRLEDMAGRFNLNNLAESDPEKRKAYIAQFKNLLTLLDLETEWADKLADWVDADTTVTYPDGGEDEVYSAQQPPYLTANVPITRVSELLALKDFGLERFRRLEPFVAALPPNTPINLCTASGVVLDSFGSNVRQFSLDAKFLERQRANGCFPTRKELVNALSTVSDDEKKRIEDATITDTKSNYFRATVTVTLGSSQFTLYSHLVRQQNGDSVASVLRSFGTD